VNLGAWIHIINSVDSDTSMTITGLEKILNYLQKFRNITSEGKPN